MSLVQAVLDVADQLEQEYVEAGYSVFRVYAKMLRMAVKAAEPDCKPPSVDPTKSEIIIVPAGATPEEVALVEGLMSKQKSKADAQESLGERMVELVGGPDVDEGTAELFPINPDMPEGAKTFVGPYIYELRDGRLHYDADATNAYQAQRRKEMDL